MDIFIQAPSLSPPESASAVSKKPFSITQRPTGSENSLTFEKVMKSRADEEKKAQEESFAAAAAASAAAASQPLHTSAAPDQNKPGASSGVAEVSSAAQQSVTVNNSLAPAENTPVSQDAPGAPADKATSAPIFAETLQTAADSFGTENVAQTGLAATSSEDIPTEGPETPQQAAAPGIPFTDGTGTDGIKQGAVTSTTSQTLGELPPKAAVKADEQVEQASLKNPVIQPNQSGGKETADPSIKTVETPGKSQQAADQGRAENVRMEEKQPAVEKRAETHETPGMPEAQPNLEAARQAPINKEIAQKLDTQAASVAQQIQESLEATIRQGKTSLRIQLSPQELGAIDIRLVSSVHGVNLTVFTEQANTGRLLEAQINQLRQSLSEAGVQINNLNIQQNQSGQTQQGFGHQQGAQPQANRFRHTPEQAGKEIIDASTGRIVRTERGVDYRV